MIEIVKYKPEDIDEIMKHPRQWEMELSQHPGWNEWKKIWYQNPAHTLMVDGLIVGCAGVIITPELEGVIGEAWMVVSNLFEKYRKACFSAIKKNLTAIIEDWCLVGIQAFVDPRFDLAKHLMVHLGFEEEHPEVVCGLPMIKYWRM